MKRPSSRVLEAFAFTATAVLIGLCWTVVLLAYVGPGLPG